MPRDREPGRDEDRLREEGRHRRHEKGEGTMTVAEAGHKGGQRVKELIEEGERSEGKKPPR